MIDLMKYFWRFSPRVLFLFCCLPYLLGIVFKSLSTRSDSVIHLAMVDHSSLTLFYFISCSLDTLSCEVNMPVYLNNACSTWLKPALKPFDKTQPFQATSKAITNCIIVIVDIQERTCISNCICILSRLWYFYLFQSCATIS